MPFRLLPRCRRLAPAAALLTAGAGHAIPLTVTVQDAQGAPLADAVVAVQVRGVPAQAAPGTQAELAQKGKRFVPGVLAIQTGTAVQFPNFDTVRHHVYSFSPIKTFELKLYAGVPGAPIVFDKPGVAVLGCNIHDSMAAWVVVADTPWAARSGANGLARIDAVPPGSYQLRVWHPGLPANTEPTPVTLTIGSADADYDARLPVRANP